jgi:parvulin-like peptidyl-prolyl isomerase
VKYTQWFVGLLLMTTIVLSACQSTDKGAAFVSTVEPNVSTDQLAFRVDSQDVSISAYEERFEQDITPILEQLLQQGSTQEAIEQMAKERNIWKLVFDRMVQDELLLHLAKQQGIGVDATAIDQEMQMRQTLDTTLTEDDLTALRSDIAREQLILKMIALHTKADRFHSRHILIDVTVPFTATEEQRAAAFAAKKGEAEAIMEQVQGGADFAALAQEKSADPGSAQNGGDLGWVTRGVFVPEFESVALSTTVALNTPVLVESAFGYHIIEVLDRKFDAPFEEVDELRQISNAGELLDASFTPWYEEYRQQAEDQGLLEINESFDPTQIPLPFPENMPPPIVMDDNLLIPTPVLPDSAGEGDTQDQGEDEGDTQNEGEGEGDSDPDKPAPSEPTEPREEETPTSN